MTDQLSATPSAGTAEHDTNEQHALVTRPRTAAGDPGTRYAGGVSLAAALGGTLLCAAGADAGRGR